jgi:ADP-ribosylglycohydrolase
MFEAAAAHAKGPAHEAVKRAAKGIAPSDFFTHQGWVLVALQNAFWCLHTLEFEEALVTTAGRGGDTDTNAAIAGALLGALHGREAIPARWIHPVLACRPLAEAGALRPRPMEYWPDDVLELAEALLIR